jgi:excisionase family DNA binding protein
MLMQMADLSLTEAARAIGVSVDTLRRWDRAGKLRTTRDQRNHRLVPASEVERLRKAPARHRTRDSFSARNRFPGRITSVEVEGDGAGRGGGRAPPHHRGDHATRSRSSAS